jgi:hypothetical protein
MFVEILTKTREMAIRINSASKSYCYLHVVVPGQSCEQQQQMGKGYRRVSRTLKQVHLTKGENPNRKS